MTATLSSRLKPRYRATFALVAFLAATLVGLLAPIVQGHAYALVCSAQGNRFVALSDGGVDPGHGSSFDHTAHCPLCVPVGAPPSEHVPDFTPVRVHVTRDVVVIARRATRLVGAPFPARGPPSLS